MRQMFRDARIVWLVSKGGHVQKKGKKIPGE